MSRVRFEARTCYVPSVDGAIEIGKGDESMTNMLSDWAREFLREDRVGVVSTLNNDGSSHLTTMWYLLADDGTLILSTLGRNQKVKNLRRDPRIAICVPDGNRYVSLSGRVSIIEERSAFRSLVMLPFESTAKPYSIPLSIS